MTTWELDEEGMEEEEGKEEEDDKEQMFVKHDDTQNFNQKVPEELIVRLDAPKSDRTGYHPLMVPMNYDLNNDIYFIGKRREDVKVI